VQRLWQQAFSTVVYPGFRVVRWTCA